MNRLREELTLRAGGLLLPGFRERATSFTGRGADQLALFNAALAAARAVQPSFDAACAAAGVAAAGCASAEDINKVPLLDRAAMAEGRNRAAGAALARLQSGGTGRSGRIETALAASDVAARYADLLSVLRETGWRMGERVTALHPAEYGYFQTFGANLRAGAYGRLAFDFAQQYLLYRLLHNRRNLIYRGGIFSSAAAARRLLDAALTDDPVLLITRPDALMAVLKTAGPVDRFRRLRAVLTVGTALGGTVRAAATERFGAPVFDMYASTELGYVGLSCPLSGGRFHLNQATHMVETSAGGSVIVTDFDNRLTPMIRYDTGDAGKLEPGPCPCGRPGPLLSIRGRRAGVVRAASGRALREIDIIDLAFPERLPFFQLLAAEGTPRLLRLPESEVGRARELAARIAILLSLQEVPATATGLELPPSGKFCYLP